MVDRIFLYLHYSLLLCISTSFNLTFTVDRTLREVVIPDFDGDAYLELPTLENVGHSLVLELWFLTRSPDGVLLYNGQMGGGGDFIALNLRNGHVEFSYNLGSGLATLV